MYDASTDRMDTITFPKGKRTDIFASYINFSTKVSNFVLEADLVRLLSAGSRGSRNLAVTLR